MPIIQYILINPHFDTTIIIDSISNEHYTMTRDSMQSLNTQMLKLGTCIFFFFFFNYHRIDAHIIDASFNLWFNLV